MNGKSERPLVRRDACHVGIAPRRWDTPNGAIPRNDTGIAPYNSCNIGARTSFGGSRFRATVPTVV